MQSTAIDNYVKELSEERRDAIQKLRTAIKKNLPKGFEECMSYGMIGYVVPHSLYPKGYHCNPKLPLPFMNIASQKNYIALHNMAIYGSEKLLKWFTDEYVKANVGKLDMGKGCIRFKKTENIPYKLIGELAAKVSPQQWVDMYEKILKR